MAVYENSITLAKIEGGSGTSLYTWIRYSSSPDGTNPQTSPSINTKYIGFAYNKSTPTSSSNPADYTWSRYAGADSSELQYVTKITPNEFVKFVSGDGDIDFQSESIIYKVDRVENKENVTRLIEDIDYKVGLTFYSTKSTDSGIENIAITDIYGLLSRLEGDGAIEEGGTIDTYNLKEVSVNISEDSEELSISEFLLGPILRFTNITGVSGSTTSVEDVATFNALKMALQTKEGSFILSVYDINRSSIGEDPQYLLDANLITYRYGTSEDMAKFSVNATNINAAIANHALTFSSNGLEIKNGGLTIVKTNDDDTQETLLEYKEGKLKIVGSGTFSGTVRATDGEFSGTISATSGTIAGFNIDGNILRSNTGALELNGETGTISGGTIKLGSNAIVDGSIILGNAQIRKTDNTNHNFIIAGEDSQIQISDEGVITLGDLTLNGNTSTISGSSFYITPELASFKNISASGKITTAIFEQGKVSSMGGALIFRSAYKISSVDPVNNTITLDVENVEQLESVINVNDTIILSSPNGSQSGQFTITAISTTSPIITVSPKNEDESLTEEYLNITDLGQTGSLIFGLNSLSTSTYGLQPEGLTISHFSGNSSLSTPEVFLGNLSSLNLGLTGFGLYGKNVYLTGSLVTETSNEEETSYAGVNTLNGYAAAEETFGDDTSNIIFWAGSAGLGEAEIQQSPFLVTKNGSIYASQGRFTGSVISDSIIAKSILKSANIYGAKIYGWDPTSNIENKASAALQLWDTNNGIEFWHSKINDEETDTDKPYFRIKDSGLEAPIIGDNCKPLEIASTQTSLEVIFTGTTFKTTDSKLNTILEITDNKLSTNDALLTLGSTTSLLINTVPITINKTKATVSQNFECDNNIYFSNTMEYQKIVQTIDSTNYVVGYDLYVREGEQ